MLGSERNIGGWYTRRVNDPGHEGVSSNPARLEALIGPLEGRTFPLTEGEVSIGREPCNQISLLDSPVSRRHCEGTLARLPKNSSAMKRRYAIEAKAAASTFRTTRRAVFQLATF